MTRETLSILPMRPEDISAVAALEQGSDGAWSEGSLADELHRPGGWQYIGLFRHDSPPVCYACGHVVDREAELYRIAVVTDRRHQGIGSDFLRTLLHMLAEGGVESCWLEVRASNTAAIGLYRKLGFTAEGVRKKYYTDPPEDAIIMQWTRN